MPLVSESSGTIIVCWLVLQSSNIKWSWFLTNQRPNDRFLDILFVYKWISNHYCQWWFYVTSRFYRSGCQNGDVAFFTWLQMVRNGFYFWLSPFVISCHNLANPLPPLERWRNFSMAPYIKHWISPPTVWNYWGQDIKLCYNLVQCQTFGLFWFTNVWPSVTWVTIQTIEI